MNACLLVWKRMTVMNCGKFTIWRGKFTDIIVKLPYNNGNFTHKIVVKKMQLFYEFWPCKITRTQTVKLTENFNVILQTFVGNFATLTGKFKI